MGVLKRGGCLGLPFESDHELRVGGDAFGKDLDGHVAADMGLDCAEDDADGSVVDLFQEPVPAEWLAPKVEPRILLQNSLVEPRQLRRGIDAELVGEDLSQPLVCIERVRLPALPVEGEHEQPPEALPQWVASDQHFQLADRPRLGAARKEPLDPRLLSFQSEPVEPSGLSEEGGLVGEVGERRPTPQR
jgi:hypothetical protein